MFFNKKVPKISNAAILAMNIFLLLIETNIKQYNYWRLICLKIVFGHL